MTKAVRATAGCLWKNQRVVDQKRRSTKRGKAAVTTAEE